MTRWFVLSLMMLVLAAATWLLLTNVPFGVKAGIPLICIFVGIYFAYLSGNQNKRREDKALYEAIRKSKR
ncbi:MAG: hypothetical protein HXY38_15010 [Chloroflexi bacterium]|nr:hypothetical protein [Chloroflexota bacterium]